MHTCTYSMYWICACIIIIIRTVIEHYSKLHTNRVNEGYSYSQSFTISMMIWSTQWFITIHTHVDVHVHGFDKIIMNQLLILQMSTSLWTMDHSKLLYIHVRVQCTSMLQTKQSNEQMTEWYTSSL